MSSCAAYPICYGRNAWSRWICPWQDSSPLDGDFENYALLFGGNVDSEQWTLTRRVGLSISGTGDKTKMEILWRDENLRIRYKPSDHSQIKIRAWQEGSLSGESAREKGGSTWEPRRAWNLPLWPILQFSETWTPWLNPVNLLNWVKTLGCTRRYLAGKAP